MTPVTAALRIAHITDPHVARTPAWREYNAKRLLGQINYRLFRRRRHRESIAAAALRRLVDMQPDVVLLTGDITQHGLDAEFEAAERLFSILSDAGIPVALTAGNHDVYGDSDPKRLENLRQTLALGQAPDAHGILHLPGVEILLLEQSVPTPPFFSHGRQDEAELARASLAWAAPPDGVMRLVGGHYPVIDPHGGGLLHFRGLRQAEKLIAFCSERQVAGYFCGHNHKRFSAEMPGGCRQFAAPSLSAARSGTQSWVGVYECGPALPQPKELTP